MQILKRAQGNSGEIVSFAESEKNVREEVNWRTYKAGYTDRDGQPMVRSGIRSRSSEAYRRNFRRAFGHD